MLTEHTYGTPAQPPLILLHPGGILHNIWQPFIREWEAQFYILAPDLLIDQTDPLSLHTLALEVLHWTQRLGLKQFDVIGASLGANVALHLAIEAPETIKHMVLDSGQPGSATPPTPLILLTRILRGLFAVMPQALITRALMSQFKAYSLTDQRMLEADITRLGKYGFVESIEAHLSHHVGERLNRIKASTLILEGSKDMLTRQGMGEKLKKGILNARIETIEGAGHVTYLSQPEIFKRHAEAFLRPSPHSNGTSGS